jgi:hypothetical protein
MLGPILSASHTSHRVFAPRSSPIPAIEATIQLEKPLVLDLDCNGQSGGGAAGGVKEELSKRLKEVFCAILVRRVLKGWESV